MDIARSQAEHMFGKHAVGNLWPAAEKTKKKGKWIRTRWALWETALSGALHYNASTNL